MEKVKLSKLKWAGHVDQNERKQNNSKDNGSEIRYKSEGRPKLWWLET